MMREKEDIYLRIENRVDHMIARGFEEEVRSLFNRGYGRHLKSMQALGYKRMVEYVCGERDLGETVRLIKGETKAYAKRQLTWFGRDPGVRWVRYPEAKERLMQLAERFLESGISDPRAIKTAITG